jgi:hypothetical protein
MGRAAALLLLLLLCWLMRLLQLRGLLTRHV